MKKLLRILWDAILLIVFLIFVVLMCLIAEAQTISSKSESTLPPRLLEIKAIKCGWQLTNEPNILPKAEVSITISYRDETWPEYKDFLGTVWDSNPDKAEEKALKLCQQYRKRLKEAQRQELKEKKNDSP